MNNSKKRKRYFVLAGVLWCVLIYSALAYGLVLLFSSEMKIDGYVLDEKTKEPISNVLLDFKNNKAVKTKGPIYTDENGEFTVTVDEKYDDSPEFKKDNYRVGGGEIEWGFKTKTIIIYLRKMN